MMDIDWEIEPTNAHEEILWSDLIVVVVGVGTLVWCLSLVVLCCAQFLCGSTRVLLFALWSYHLHI